MINLFTGYFKTTNKDRQKELDYCLSLNQYNPLIDNIFTFKDRFTYQDFFLNTLDYPDDINILANGDIYFENLELALNIDYRECYALTRWEISNGQIVPFEVCHQYNREAKAKHSQDVWIFKGSVKDVRGDFYLGQPGCDNKIAYELLKVGYRVTNPSLDIKCIHVHKETSRNYTLPDRVPPPYKWIEQTHLNPAKQGIYRRI